MRGYLIDCWMAICWLFGGNQTIRHADCQITVENRIYTTGRAGL